MKRLLLMIALAMVAVNATAVCAEDNPFRDPLRQPDVRFMNGEWVLVPVGETAPPKPSTSPTPVPDPVSTTVPSRVAPSTSVPRPPATATNCCCSHVGPVPAPRPPVNAGASIAFGGWRQPVYRPAPPPPFMGSHGGYRGGYGGGYYNYGMRNNLLPFGYYPRQSGVFFSVGVGARRGW